MLHFKKYLSLNKLLQPYLIRKREIQNTSPISQYDKSKQIPGAIHSHLNCVYFYALKGEEMRRQTHILSTTTISVLGFTEWNDNNLISFMLLSLSYSKPFFWSETAFSWISMTSCLKYQLLYKLWSLFSLILFLHLLSWSSNVFYILFWVSKVTEDEPLPLIP